MGDRQEAGAARHHRYHSRQRYGHRIAGQLRGRDPRGHGYSQGGGCKGRLYAGARLPVRRRSGAISRQPPGTVHGGAESRRPIQVAADPGKRGREIQIALALALQRAADFLRFHRGGHFGGSAAAAERTRRRARLGARMTYFPKPKVAHPSLPRNELGLTRREYEGAMSTLCAGCGHDSITAAIVEACWSLSIEPQNLVKLSGIGCSSKTTAYFVSGSHGFNSVHGRMPSIAMGANAANRKLYYLRSEEHTSELQ